MHMLLNNRKGWKTNAMTQTFPQMPDGIGTHAIYRVLIYLGASTKAHMVNGRGLEKLLHASYELHVHPRRSPKLEDGELAREASCISISRMESGDVRQIEFTGPHWWSTPGLGVEGAVDDGARIICWKRDTSREVQEAVQWSEETAYYGEVPRAPDDEERKD